MNKGKLETLAQPVVDIYTELETELLTNMAEKLAQNKNLLELDPEAYKMQQIDNLGLLNKSNIEIIKNKANLSAEEMNKVLINAGVDGLELTEKELKDALKKGADLLVPDPISESPKMYEILNGYQRQAISTLNLTNQSLIGQTNKMYVESLDKITAEMLTGSITGDQALRKTIKGWSQQGIPVFIDRAGRQRGVEGYVRSILMTTSNNVVNQMQDARLEEWGVDLVEISSHAGNRPGCEPYAGKIFSINPNHPKYPYLYDPSIGDIGEPHSLFGVNCGHIKYPFVDGISIQRNHPNDPELNKMQYEQGQKQRQIERNIRKAKTQEQMLLAAGDNEGAMMAKQLVKQRQSMMREFIEVTGRTRRYNREGVFGFGSVPVPKGKLMPGYKGPSKYGVPVKLVPKKKGPTPAPKTSGNVKTKLTQAQMSKMSLAELKEYATELMKDYHIKIGSGLSEANQKALLYGAKKTNLIKDITSMQKVLGLTKAPKKAIPKKAATTQAAKKAETTKEQAKYPTKPKLVDTDDIYWMEEIELRDYANQLMAYIHYDKSPDFLKENKKFLAGKSSDELQAIILKLHDEVGNVASQIKALESAAKLEALMDSSMDSEKFKMLTANSAEVQKHKQVLLEQMNALERAAINDYTGSSYGPMNRYLRSNGKDENKEFIVKKVENLKKVFERHAIPLSQDTKFYRRADAMDAGLIFGNPRAGEIINDMFYGNMSEKVAVEQLNKLLGNATMMDKGFISTSYKDSVFTKNTGVEFQILAPKGFKGGIIVDPISQFEGVEFEYLIRNGQKFLIQNVTVENRKTGNNRGHYVVVQITPIED